jgi:hypothetical protein
VGGGGGHGGTHANAQAVWCQPAASRTTVHSHALHPPAPSPSSPRPLPCRHHERAPRSKPTRRQAEHPTHVVERWWQVVGRLQLLEAGDGVRVTRGHHNQHGHGVVKGLVLQAAQRLLQLSAEGRVPAHRTGPTPTNDDSGVACTAGAGSRRARAPRAAGLGRARTRGRQCAQGQGGLRTRGPPRGCHEATRTLGRVTEGAPGGQPPRPPCAPPVHTVQRTRASGPCHDGKTGSGRRPPRRRCGSPQSRTRCHQEALPPRLTLGAAHPHNGPRGPMGTPAVIARTGHT